MVTALFLCPLPYYVNKNAIHTWLRNTRGHGAAGASPGGRRDRDMYRPERTGPYRMQYETNKKIVLASQDICAICGKPVDKTIKPPHPLSASIDHIIPIAKGGHPADLSNLQLAHRACNRQKGTKLAPNIKKEDVDPNRDLPHSRNWKVE